MTDETGEWVAIAKVIAEAGDPDQRGSEIFAADLDSEVDFDRLLDLHSAAHSVTIGMDETWRVLTEPRLVAGGVWFLAHDLALVAAESRIRGAVTLQQSVPLLFVLKKNGPQWTISTVRRLAPGAVIKKASLQSVQ